MDPTTDHARRISAAAEAIAARGDNPTLSAVRAELGGGSYSTISPVLRAWKAAQVHDEPVRELLPERLHEAAIAGTAEIWRTAVELSSERLTAERGGTRRHPRRTRRSHHRGNGDSRRARQPARAGAEHGTGGGRDGYPDRSRAARRPGR